MTHLISDLGTHVDWACWAWLKLLQLGPIIDRGSIHIRIQKIGMYNSQANYYPPGLDPELNLGLSDHNVLGRVMVFPQAAV